MTRRHGFWLAAIVLLLVAASVVLAAPSTVVLSVDGMTWGAWPVAVKRALEGLPGVQRADVSFRDKEARVTFDPARVTTDQLIQAIDKLGFRAAVKSGG
jgi:mercuric ion binding protein